MRLSHPATPRTTSVVVATCQRPDALERCLRALAEQSAVPDEILVIESGEPAAGVEAIARSAGAGYLREPRGGASRARNLGLRAARGEIVAFTDDDALPAASWLAAIAAPFEDAAVAGVGGRVRPGPDGVGEAGSIARWIGIAECGGEAPRRFDRDTPAWFEIVNFGGLGNGPSMAFRRAALLAVGGFDERLGPGTPLRGGEEPFAFFRLVDAGWALAYQPEAVVEHPVPLPPLAQLHERKRHAYASATGYAVFLILRHPTYSGQALRYVLEGTVGRRRAWRDPPAAVPPMLPRWPRLLAGARGVGLGVRSAIGGLGRK